MDIEKTREYYKNLTREDLCTCDCCQNLADEIKDTYPEVAQYLATLGVKIEFPFEADIPYEIERGIWEFISVQYLICGSKD